MRNLYRLQVGANLTVVGSKKWSPEDKAAFLSNAPATKVIEIDGQPVVAKLREFKTGSVGYYTNGKTVFEVGAAEGQAAGEGSTSTGVSACG